MAITMHAKGDFKKTFSFLEKAKEVVRWNTESIVDAIRRLGQ